MSKRLIPILLIAIGILLVCVEASLAEEVTIFQETSSTSITIPEDQENQEPVEPENQEPVEPEPTTIQWKDWPDQHHSAVRYVAENKLMIGYTDGTFRPWAPVTEQQVVRVCERAGIRTGLREGNFSGIPATMGWIEENFLPGTVFTAASYEECTRFRLAVMVERYGMNPGPNTNVKSRLGFLTASRLNTWFSETYVTWSGKKRQTKLVGMGQTFVDYAEKHRIPLWLALGQCWRESQWFTTGLSVNYNCGWGIKASPGKWGKLGNPNTVQGYGNYISVEEAIKAYFVYMDTQVDGRGNYLYRNLIDSHNWRSILNIYAPLYENDGAQHYSIVMQVKRWCEEHGLDTFDKERGLW